MSTWNHRVVKQTYKGEVAYAIHEVHSSVDNPELTGSCTIDPVAPSADEVEGDYGLRWVLLRMLDALDKPVLDYDNLTGHRMDGEDTV